MSDDPRVLALAAKECPPVMPVPSVIPCPLHLRLAAEALAAADAADPLTRLDLDDPMLRERIAGAIRDAYKPRPMESTRSFGLAGAVLAVLGDAGRRQ